MQAAATKLQCTGTVKNPIKLHDPGNSWPRGKSQVDDFKNGRLYMYDFLILIYYLIIKLSFYIVKLSKKIQKSLKIIKKYRNYVKI